MCNQLWLKDIKSVWWLECEIKKWNDKEINTHSFDSHSQQIINNINKIQYSLFIERENKFKLWP
jgi:hypothetical protein